MSRRLAHADAQKTSRWEAAMNKAFLTTSALAAALSLAACSEPSSDPAAETTAADAPAAASPEAAPAAETPAAPAEEETPEASAGGWTAPRTPWGDPDLRGMWPLESISGTPFQRPPRYGDRLLLTDEEYAERVEQQNVRAGQADAEEEAGKLGGGQWFEWDAAPLRQTSLIVEPANGRIPPMTEKGQAIAANMKSSWSQEVFEWLDDFNALDRCITRGMPATMINFPYNNGLEVFQSPGYVVFRHEMIHETRIIPLDGRPPLPSNMKTWLGESRGHWEGDTLVIETTNFNGLSPMVIVGPSNEPVPTSASLRMTERLTPTGPDTIQYEAWVEDPEVLTGPWKMAFPWTRNEAYESYEYACHEGNTVIPYYIRSTSPRFVDTTTSQGFSGPEQIGLTLETTQTTEEPADAGNE
jgi:hypothetical protein